MMEDGERREEKRGREFIAFSLTHHSSLYIFQSVILLACGVWPCGCGSVLLSLCTETRSPETEEALVASLLLIIICSLFMINLTLGLGRYVIL